MLASRAASSDFAAILPLTDPPLGLVSYDDEGAVIVAGWPPTVARNIDVNAVLGIALPNPPVIALQRRAPAGCGHVLVHLSAGAHPYRYRFIWRCHWRDAPTQQ